MTFKLKSIVLLFMTFIYTITLYSQEENKQIPTSEGEIIHIDFVGTGNIQNSLSQGNGIEASTGLGVVYERYRGDASNIIRSFEIEAIINVASTVDTISAVNKVIENDTIIENIRDFGTYLLNPTSSKQSFYLNSNVYFDPIGNSVFNKISRFFSGLNFRIQSANTVWKNEDTYSNLGVLAIRGGVFHEFLPDNYLRDNGKTKYSIFLGVNYGYRGIFGDITTENNEKFRTDILGTDRTNFSGMEINFGFRLTNIQAEFQIPLLYGKDEATVSGLTNTQFLFTIRFIGGFSLKLNDQNKTNLN